MPGELKTRTKLVHAGARRSAYGEMAEAIFLTQGYTYPDAQTSEARFIASGPDEYTYTRVSNPTTRSFEERMAAIEGTEDALATASGMAAVSGALCAMLSAGDHVVAARALFGSCLYILEDLLTRFGVRVSFVDGTDLDAWRGAVVPGTKAVFFETLANPTLEIVDIGAVAEIAHAAGALVVVDNVFSTPLFSRPVELGADVVVYSATKHIDGQGRAMGGVICGTQRHLHDVVHPYVKHTGGCMSPFTSWLMLGGLVTLDLRCRAMAESAARIAGFLEREGSGGKGPGGGGKVTRVLYPGLESHPQHALARRQMTAGGTIVTFELAGGKEAAFRFQNALRVAMISNNLGDARSIATHPATTTHQRLGEERRRALGITPGMIRFSVGLEDADDLIDDLAQALAAV